MYPWLPMLLRRVFALFVMLTCANMQCNRSISTSLLGFSTGATRVS